MSGLEPAPSQLTSSWRFSPIERVGSGATSEVWRALDQASGQRVALKLARSEAQAMLLADEAEALMLADSPRIPSLIDLGRVPSQGAPLPMGAVYLALSWAEGTPLSKLQVREASQRWGLALAVAHDLGEALSHLHDSGVAHGDIKPSNVLIEQPGAHEYRATLVDLGFSRAVDGGRLRGATPHYLPPEAGTGSMQPHSHDLWALGVLLAELVCPEILQSHEPHEAIKKAELPSPFDAWCLALCASDPAARPSASWIAASAKSLLAPDKDQSASEVRRIRAAYLRVRSAEIFQAAQAREVKLDESVAQWLVHAVQVTRSVARLRSQQGAAGERLHLGPMDTAQRARWLVALVGSAAASWSIDGQLRTASEQQLAASLERLAARIPPGAWSLRDVSRAVENDLPQASDARLNVERLNDVELALELVRRPVSGAVLEQSERRCLHGKLSARHAILLADALRSQGEMGRALVCLTRVQVPDAIVMRSELYRRMGDRTAAALAAQAAVELGGSWAERGRAILARLLVDEGKADDALGLLGEGEGIVSAEVRALAHLSLGRREEVHRDLSYAMALGPDEEMRARLECVRGMEAHARGDALAAHAAFSRAVDHAVRAGAVVEEATYRTGVAAAAVDAGLVSEALEASRRSSLLWEHLGRPVQWAFALLARASVFSLIGARHEARLEAEQARDCARRARAHRAEAFSWLVLSDIAPDDSEQGTEAAAHASEAIGAAAMEEDRIRIYARLLRFGALTPEKVALTDRKAAGWDTSPTAACDWWAARGAAALRGRSHGRDEEIVSHVMRLVRTAAPVGCKGPALHSARQLAARLTDGEATRLLASAQLQLVSKLVDTVPIHLRDHLASVSWIAGLESSDEPGVSSQQVRNLEALVRALASRDSLRSLLNQVLDALVLWTGVERGLLLLRAPDDRLVIRAARNLARSDLKGHQLELSQSLARRALAEREPVVAVDAAGEISELHASVHVLGLRSVLAVPLLARGEALGVVYLDDRIRKGAFGAKELAWVRLIAGIASVAIADARDQLLLRRAVRKSNRAGERMASLLAEREAQLSVVAKELARERKVLTTRYPYQGIIGQSEPMRAMLELVDRVTPTTVPVLLCGESGSGKELVARALHRNGPRASAPFVSENCSAIPESLLESTLFGHVRGAFTGADRPRVGLFEAADGGTLFLDEIGEMPLTMQSKLLRVLQDGEVHPLGSSRVRKVNVRVIAATNRDLAAMVREGRFREDLLYRLNVITVAVPALRDRIDDIPVLVRHFLDRYGEGRSVQVTTEAMSRLCSYQWPGNVRQLENEIRRALVLCDERIEPRHLSPELRLPSADPSRVSSSLEVRVRVDALERELVCRALGQTKGNQTRAAQLLGLSRFGLQKMLKRLEVSESDWERPTK